MLFRGEFNYFKKSACGNFMPLALLAVLSTLFCENTLSASLKPQAHRDAKYSDQINKTFSMSQEDDSFDSDEEENQIEAENKINDIDDQNELSELIGDSSHKELTIDGSSGNLPKIEAPAKEIFLNFDNASLSNFITYMADLKEINIIPNSATDNHKISLTIREPLDIPEAWSVFLTVLEMAGYSIVEVGQVHKIIAKDSKYTEPLPVYIGIPAENLPDSDQTVRFVTFLTNLQVTDQQVGQLLQSMLNQGALFIPQETVNGFIITDRCYNIKSAMKVINALDNSGYQETVSVLTLNNANAEDVKKLLTDIIKKPDQQSSLARLLGYNSDGTSELFSSSTKIIPEERTNSLILMGSKKSIDSLEEFITTHIDKSLSKTESPIHVYELQFADAEQIKAVLDDVTSQNQSRSAAGKFGGVRGGVKYFNSIKIEADKSGNRLLVSSIEKQDWKLLKQTIEDLDKPQPQVAIETLIVQIDENNLKELGGQFRNIDKDSPIPNVNFQSAGLSSVNLEKNGSGDIVGVLGNLLSSLAGNLAKGSSAFTISNASSVWAVFRALNTRTNTSILDRPFITVANRTKGRVSVGERRRIKKESVISADSSQPAGYEPIDAKTLIEYEPQINPDGIINLKVNVDLSNFTNLEGDKSTKLIKTTVTVANGQVLVLGGFVKTKVTETRGKTPILGDVPILGWLFKNKKRRSTKSYIFVFVSPTIVKPRQSPGSSLYTKMKLHSATDNIEDAVSTAIGKDPIHNWFFNPDGENYSHKVVDFASARYQPTTVDIRNDPYYRSFDLKKKNQTPSFHTESSRLSQDLEEPFQAKATLRNESKIKHPSVTDEELEKKREKLKLLVSKNKIPNIAPKAQTKTAAKTPRGQFKTFIAPHKSENEQKAHEIHTTETKNIFKKFIADKPINAENQAKEQFKDMLSGDEETPEETAIKSLPERNKYLFKSLIAKDEMPDESYLARERLKQLVSENPMENPFSNGDAR